MVAYIGALSADGLSVHLLDIYSQKAFVNLLSEIRFFFFAHIDMRVFNHHILTTSWTQGFDAVALGSEAPSGQVTCLQPVKITGL